MRALLFVLLLGAAAPALGQTATQVYVWKDARGITHYTQTPPPKGAYRVRGVARPPSSSAPAAAAGKPASSVVERCATARRNLEILGDAGNASIGLDADGDGKPDAPMSAEERARQRQLAEDSVRVHCNARP